MTGTWHEIGPHRIHIEGDVVLSRWQGACTLEELNEFLPLLEAELARHRHVFLLVDNTRAAPGRPEVRRRLFDWARTHSVSGGVIVFGAPPATRVIGMLVLNAIALLKGEGTNKRLVIVSDEQAAYVWLARRRAELGQ